MKYTAVARSRQAHTSGEILNSVKLILKKMPASKGIKIFKMGFSLSMVSG
jgi:hypothetical protein